MRDLAKAMAIRFGVYGVLVIYLACDLFVFQGPVHKSLNEPQLDKKTEIRRLERQAWWHGSIIGRFFGRKSKKRWWNIFGGGGE